MEIWKNNNLLKKYRESLPVDERDDYAEWKKDYNYKNTSEYKRDKFKNQLDTKLNRKGIRETWLEFGESIMDDFFMDPGLIYEQDMNINTENLFELGLGLDDIFDGISQTIWFNTGKNDKYYGKYFTDVIDSMMKSKKVTIGLSFKFRSSLFEESNNRSLKNFINLYTKDLIYNYEIPRRDVGKTRNFLINFDKVITPYVDRLEKDLNIMSIDIDSPYIDQNKVLNCGIHFEIPYNFGVKNNDTEDMKEEAEKLRKHIHKIENFVSPYLLCEGE